jgi:hypothetical protein
MKPWHFAVVLVAGWTLGTAAGRAGNLPLRSQVPATIALVGSSAGTPDAAFGRFTVRVRDLADNPVRGASVVVDLTNATDLALCDDQRDADALVNCAARTVRKFSDSNGEVSFTVLGGSNGAGNATTFLQGGRIYANGTLIGSPTVAAYDLDSFSGVGANDLSAWLADFGSGEPYGRADYDGTGHVGANDLSFWLAAYGAAGSTSSCAASCP